jgi:addiction module HigA family antidote
MVDVPMTHPGEHLAEILEDLRISTAKFARATEMDEGRLSAIINTLEPITADVAVRIGRALDMTPEFWLSLQSDYDLETASGVAAEVEPIPEAIVM